MNSPPQFDASIRSSDPSEVFTFMEEAISSTTLPHMVGSPTQRKTNLNMTLSISTINTTGNAKVEEEEEEQVFFEPKRMHRSFYAPYDVKDPRPESGKDIAIARV